jgi:hypothetical protein
MGIVTIMTFTVEFGDIVTFTNKNLNTYKNQKYLKEELNM